MVRAMVITAIITVAILALIALGAAALGYPGVAGATAGIAQLTMYLLLIVGVSVTVFAVVSRYVTKD